MTKDSDDFNTADEESSSALIPSTTMGSVGSYTIVPGGMMQERQRLIREYHKGSSSLASKLEEEGKNNLQSLVMALVDEVVKETDNLLGNQLLATQDGLIRDATIISHKRADVLEKAIKAVQTKQMFDKDNGIDIDSPYLRIILRFFMSKVKEVFHSLNYSDEASDTFFRALSLSMDNWKRELRFELDKAGSLSVE